MDYSIFDNAEDFSLDQAAMFWCETEKITSENSVRVEVIFQQLQQAADRNELAHEKAYLREDRLTASIIDWAKTRVKRTALRQWVDRANKAKPLFLYPESRPDWIGDSETPWDHATNFTLREAATALAGKGAVDSDVDGWLAVLIEAARRGEFPTANRRDSWNDPGDSILWVTTLDPGESARVLRADLRKWTEARGIRGREYARFLFPRHGAQSPAPWPGHSTPELELLKLAIFVHWEKIKADERPLKKIVVAWLKGQRAGLSDNLANAMDTIMRPPELRDGGIKGHNKGKN